MMRPHAFAGMQDADGTATIIGLAAIVLAVVIGLILDARAEPRASAVTPVIHTDDEDDADIWVFP